MRFNKDVACAKSRVYRAPVKVLEEAMKSKLSTNDTLSGPDGPEWQSLCAVGQEGINVLGWAGVVECQRGSN